MKNDLFVKNGRQNTSVEGTEFLKSIGWSDTKVDDFEYYNDVINIALGVDNLDAKDLSKMIKHPKFVSIGTALSENSQLFVTINRVQKKVTCKRCKGCIVKHSNKT